MDGQLDVFARGPGLTLWQKTYSGSTWSDWKNLGGGAVASAPAAVSWGPDRIDLFARGAGNTLLQKTWDTDSWRP